MLSVQYAAANDDDDDDESSLYELCLELPGTQNCKLYSGINLLAPELFFLILAHPVYKIE